jgi:hypothetical protein
MFVMHHGPVWVHELKRKEVCNLFVNTHERIEIYREFYHCIIYIANEGRQFRLTIIVNKFFNNLLTLKLGRNIVAIPMTQLSLTYGYK